MQATNDDENMDECQQENEECLSDKSSDRNEPIDVDASSDESDSDVDSQIAEGSRNDCYCWLCHTGGDVLCCDACPRVFHLNCLSIDSESEQNPVLQSEWVCFECKKAERANEQQLVLTSIDPDDFYFMLECAVRRLYVRGSEPFQEDVDTTVFNDYKKYIHQPMSLSKIQQKIQNREYTSLEPILQDIKWIYHNCVIYNGAKNRLTGVAESLIKAFKREINEIETCTNCYMNWLTKNPNEWFIESCHSPHLLIYAKVNGYPYWPAKVLRSVGSHLDVKFFGAHDRHVVPVDKCVWLSEEWPERLNSQFSKTLKAALAELEQHIAKLEQRFGTFFYARKGAPVDMDNAHVFVKATNDANCSNSSIAHSMSDRITTRAKRSISIQSAANSSALDVSTDNATAASTPSKSLRRSAGAAMSASKQSTSSSKTDLTESSNASSSAKSRTSTTTTTTTPNNSAKRGSSSSGVVEKEPSPVVDNDSESNSSQMDSVKRSKRLRQSSKKYLGSVYTTLDVPNKRSKLAQQQQSSATNTTTSSSSNTAKNTTPAKRAQQAPSSSSRAASLNESASYTHSDDADFFPITSTAACTSELEVKHDNKQQQQQPTLLTLKITKSKSRSQVTAESVTKSTVNDSESASKVEVESLSSPKDYQIVLKEEAPSTSNVSAGDKETTNVEKERVEQPIKIKFSRNNSNNKTNNQRDQMSVVTNMHSVKDEPATASKQDSPKPSATTMAEEGARNSDAESMTTVAPPPSQPSFKINLGDLVKNCKSKLGIGSSKSPLTLPAEDTLAEQPKSYPIAASVSVEVIESPSAAATSPAPPATTTLAKKKRRMSNSSSLTNVFNGSIVTDTTLTAVLENQPASSSDQSERKPTESSSCSILTNEETIMASVSATEVTSGGSPFTTAQVKKSPTKRPKILKPMILNVSGNVSNSVVGHDSSILNQLSQQAVSNHQTGINRPMMNVQPVAAVGNTQQTNANGEVDKRASGEFKRKSFLDAIKNTYEELFKEIKLNTDSRIKEILYQSNLNMMRMKSEHVKMIAEIKSKTWCAGCGAEAHYYCCWNTSYCTEECQHRHWPNHYQTCCRLANTTATTTASSSSSNDNEAGLNYGSAVDEEQSSSNDRYSNDNGHLNTNESSGGRYSFGNYVGESKKQRKLMANISRLNLATGEGVHSNQFVNQINSQKQQQQQPFVVNFNSGIKGLKHGKQRFDFSKLHKNMQSGGQHEHSNMH